MKQYFLFFIASFIIAKITVAQKKAITDNGDEVILYDNGTWKYTKEFIDTASFIKTNPIAYKKPADANFLIKSKLTHVGFWINPKKWSFGKSTSNENAEYELHDKDGTMLVEVISEKLGLPLKTLRTLAIKNARAVAPDLQIVKEEYRTVNGLKVLLMWSEGTISDIRFIYYGYYYSDSSSSTQYLLIGMKDAGTFNERKADSLLNGLVVPDGKGIVLSEPAETVKVDVKSPSQANSLSAGEDCKKLFPGKWNYSSQQEKITLGKTLNQSIEPIGDYAYEFD